MNTQTTLPSNGTLVGRVWNANAQGPSVIVVRDGHVIDITSKQAPLVRDICEMDNPVSLTPIAVISSPSASISVAIARRNFARSALEDMQNGQNASSAAFAARFTSSTEPRANASVFPLTGSLVNVVSEPTQFPAIRCVPLSMTYPSTWTIIFLYLMAWAAKMGIHIQYIQPGKPQQNAYIERYNRTVRHEWLDQNIFATIQEAQEQATNWLWTYNNDRPNMAIGGITPVMKLKLAA